MSFVSRIKKSINYLSVGVLKFRSGFIFFKTNLQNSLKLNSPKFEKIVKLGESGFSTALVIVITVVIGVAMLGVMQTVVFSSQSAERSIAFSQFSMLNQQIGTLLRAVPDSLWNPAAVNSCTTAFTAGGAQTFNTVTGSTSANMKIYNSDGSVLYDAGDAAHNKMGRIIITGINLVSQGMIGGDASLYKAKLNIQTRMNNASATDRIFKNDVSSSQTIWVSIRTAVPGPGVVNIQSCSSNFFTTSTSTPLPMPTCGVGEVLYASETSGTTGLADSISCIRILCPKPDGTTYGTGQTGWAYPSSYATDGNGVCP